jgi:hypothetical protein
MKDSTWSVQTAVRTVLLTLHYEVLDNPTKDTQYPYLTISYTDNDAGTKGENRQEIDFKVHCWSRYAGMKQIDEMKNSVMGALTHGSLSTLSASFTTPTLFYRGCVTLEEPENEVIHAVLSYTIITCEVV